MAFDKLISQGIKHTQRHHKMPLVDYDSSSDDSDSEQPQPVVKATPTPTVTTTTKDIKDSIASFLPPPKNRQPQMASKGRILGAGIKNTINSQVAQNPDNIVLPKGTAAITSLIPSSVRGKTKKTSTSTTLTKPTIPQTSQHSTTVGLNLFQDVKTRSKPMIQDNTKIQIKSIHDEDGDETMADEEDPRETLAPHKRPLEEEPEIKEFNLSNFYDQNIELKAQGLLQENKRLHTVTNHKNQLSALVKNAKMDQGLLEEKFERNKKQRKEKAERYGW